MFDLFGLKKGGLTAEGGSGSAPDADAPSAEPATEPSPGSAKLWAAALVVDSLFVMVFGGAVAAKVYQHWKAPTAPPAAQRPVKRPKLEAPSVPEAAAPAPAQAAPVKAPEPPKAAAPPPNGPKGARPSLLSEAPRSHETPKPASAPGNAASSPAGAPAASAGPGKAVPVEFQFKDRGAKSVELGGAFIVRNNGRKSMVRHADGRWTLTLYLTPNTYRYFFFVDGKKVMDPDNAQSDRGASVMTVQPQ